MAEKTKRDLVDEIERKDATIYNLRLYIGAALKAVPHLKRYLNEHFNGMPGFVEEKESEK